MFSIGRMRRSDDERGMQRLNPRIRYSRDVMHYFEEDTDSEEDATQNTTQDSKPKDQKVNGLTLMLEESNIKQ